MSAYALELYNEDLLDLATHSGRGDGGTKGWDASKAQSGGLKLQVWTETEKCLFRKTGQSARHCDLNSPPSPAICSMRQ